MRISSNKDDILEGFDRVIIPHPEEKDALTVRLNNPNENKHPDQCLYETSVSII